MDVSASSAQLGGYDPTPVELCARRRATPNQFDGRPIEVWRARADPFATGWFVNGGERQMRVNDLKGRVARDGYVVDADAVAEAMLRRRDGRRLLTSERHAGVRTRASRFEARRRA